MPKKTRPIGTGVRNITVTLPVAEVLRTEKRARISGVERSPYIRAVVEWANDNGVVVRPEAESYKDYLSALEGNVSPLPKIKYEIVLTDLLKPLLIATTKAKKLLSDQIIYVDGYDTAASRLGEDPTHAAASQTPVMPRKMNRG